MVRVWPAARPLMDRRASRPGPSRCSSTVPEGTPVITNLPPPSVMVLRLVPVTLTRIPLAPDVATGAADIACGAPVAVAPITTVPWSVAPAGLDAVGELDIEPQATATRAR